MGKRCKRYLSESNSESDSSPERRKENKFGKRHKHSRRSRHSSRHYNRGCTQRVRSYTARTHLCRHVSSIRQLQTLYLKLFKLKLMSVPRFTIGLKDKLYIMLFLNSLDWLKNGTNSFQVYF